MEKWGEALRGGLIAAAIIAVTAVGTHSLEAQPVITRPAAAAATPAEEDAGPGNFAAPDRNVLQSLKRAQKVLKEHRYGEALEGLNQILRTNEDYFYRPDPKASIYKSLKTEAQQLLGEMPREGRDLYELRSGAEARNRLRRAAAAGDDAALSEVSAQLFHTQAGYEATFLLALYQMDHSAPLAAALTLKRLHDAGTAAEGFEPGLSLTQAACYFQAGMLNDCRQVLVDLKRRQAKPTLKLAQKEVPWFDDASDSPAWLAKLTGLKRMPTATETDRWSMFRGDPSRNASIAGGMPLLNLRWRVPVTDDPILEKFLTEQQTFYHDHSTWLFSALHPLAVGDLIFMRTTSNVLAIDFRTGKRLWPTNPERDPQEQDTRMNRFNPWGQRNNTNQQYQYCQRIWDDAAYGTLSSDGNLLFVIEELPLGVSGQNMGFVMFANGRNDPSNKSITNKLAAYDIRTGKITWELGGQESLQKSDTFFLGPPLALRGQLYVMAEVKEEMRLLTLDAATGNQVWSQQLSMVEANITQDPVRRLAGVSPSYCDGVLICPTGANCVVAVDLATHTLLWGYIYSRPGETVQGRRMRGMNQVQMAFNNNAGFVPRWLDGTATIVNGKVLLTPAEADFLYCLNLADGKPLWAPQPRGEHVYVACVHKGVVVLVGRNSIDAIKLEDGSKAWGGNAISIPAGAAVCGRGCYVGNQYFVPVNSGEVMAIDVESGKVVATAKSRRSAVPGNLICYRDRVISQGLDGLELYYQVDAARDEVARRLVANPEDVEGLTLRGEMKLDAGKSAEAVADFRRAYNLDKKSESHGRTRELLRDALLAGLRDDFAAHRSMAAEVEPLLDDAAQRATFLRYMAAGFQRAHEWPEAVDQYLKLVDLEEGKPVLEKVDRSYFVRRECWVESCLGTLRSEGGAAVAAQLDQALERRLETAKKESGVDGLKRFLAFFGNQPQAVVAGKELLQRLTQQARIMEAELQMTASTDATDRKAQAALLANIAALNYRAGRTADAAACFRALQRQFADVPCHAGLTGQQWLAAFPEGDALRKECSLPSPTWPRGEVQANRPDTSENRSYRFEMHMVGPRSPFFAECNLSLDNNQQEVGLRDNLGNPQKSVRLVENGRAFGVFYNPSSTLARSCGHLLVISTGSRICALDPWKVSGGSSSLLWAKDLIDSTTDAFGNVMFVNRGVDNEYRPNPFGPVNSRYVSFVRRRSIVVVDPMSGDTLWERHNIPARSEIFGDEDYLFVFPPDKDEASVYRAGDGQLLGTRKVPKSRFPGNFYFDGSGMSSALVNAGVEYLGRYALTWGQADGVLAYFDPWLKKPVWPSRKFAASSHVSLVGCEAVGVLEPSGHFVLVALADGRTIADLQLEVRPQFPATDLLVTRMGDEYIVVANDNRVLGNGMEDQNVQPPQGAFCYMLRRARIYALDLNGKSIWPAPVDVDHQYFIVSQPARLPVLLFGSIQYDNRNGRMTMRSSLVAVDRRDGRIVFDEPSRGPMRGIGVDIRGDPADKNVRVVTNNENVTLTFTDKPIRSVVRRSSGVKKPSGKLGEALLDAVQGVVGMPR
jgi:outer membrane protein assembly factor BamB